VARNRGPDYIDFKENRACRFPSQFSMANASSFTTVAVLRLHDGGYEEAGVYRRGESAASILAPEFTIVVNQLFDAVKQCEPA